MLAAIIVVINVIGSLSFFRIDLTSEHRFTLSDATKNLLTSFDDVLYVKVYLQGDLPADFQKLRLETKQMLDEFRAYNGKIEYQFINPLDAKDEKENKKVAEQLQFKGLESFQIEVPQEGGSKTQQVFPGAIMSYGDKEVPVKLLMTQMGVSAKQQINSSVQNLEYALANGIRSLVKTDKPLVGFLQGNDELDPKYIADFARTLSENYKVDKFNIHKFKSDSTGQNISILDQQRKLNRFDALIVAKPQKPFTQLDQYLLDQYIMTGGKVIWLIDAVYANMDSLTQSSQFISFPTYDKLGISDMLFKYGVRINTNIVTDMLGAGVSDRKSIRPWIYFPMVMPQENNPITKDLNAIKLEFPSSVDTIIAPGVKKTILLQSSPYANIVGTPHIVRLQYLYQPPPEGRFRDKNVPMAVMLEGKFESAFKNRITPKQNGSEKLKLLTESVPTQMLVVADGDIIKNQLNVVNPNIPKGAPLPLGFDQYTQTQYGNKDFLLNAVDYMLDDSGLIDIRSRELKIRLLSKKAETERVFWELLNTLVPILVILLFGIVYTIIRRRKYAY